jgi:nucleoside-diphosphate-sugar epimerase
MTILVTGGTGRIGKHLVNALKKKNKVRVLVKKTTRIRGAKTVKGNILDKKSLEKALEGVDTIYHLAAVVDYLTPKDIMHKVNVVGTKNLLEVSKGRFIYLGTTGVLGKKLPYLPADENTPYNPDNYYDYTKMEAEKEVLAHEGIVLRATDVYGPGFKEGYSTVISKIDNGTMKIIGHGNNLIQYTHVNDLIQGLLLAKNKGRKNEIYHIAGNEIKTQRELYEITAKYLGVPAPTKIISKKLALLYAKMEVMKHKRKGTRPKIIPEYI